MKNIILDGLDRFNYISTLIKLYPDSGIQKSTFYELKYEFITYLLRTDDIKLSYKAICKYKTLYNDVYKIQFNIDNIIKEITVADTYSGLYNIFEVHHFKDIDYYPIPYEIPVIEEYDDSYNMSNHNVYDEYCKLIHWICNNKFFFLHNEWHTFNILHDIGKDSNYIVYTDPSKPITKLSYRHYDIICGYYDKDKNKILWHTNDLVNIKELFTDEYIKLNYKETYLTDKYYNNSVRLYHIYYGQCTNIKYPQVSCIDMQPYSHEFYIKQHANAIIKLHNHQEKYNQTSTRYFML